MTLLGAANARGETGSVKFWALMVVGLALMVLGVVGCATGPNPCIGSAKDRETFPCTCPQTLNPACAPWPNDDTKRPTTPDGGSTR
jgi:hypothetical protein